MTREYFDLMIIVPLEEELLELLEVFPTIKSYSTDTTVRYSINTGASEISALVIQQEGMGKAWATQAASNALKEFDAGLIVCIGIAGGLSNDVSLCDVCYTGTIIDVYENSKALDEPTGKLDLEFSPTHFQTQREITTSLNFSRIDPSPRVEYVKWQLEQFSFAKSLIDGPIIGRDGKPEELQSPKSINGTIACGLVSKSTKYNEKIKALDRKTLAIETESGGVFAVAAAHNIPALAIRGISDYADSNKGKLEEKSKGAVRRIAAANAATFLRMQLNNTFFRTLVFRMRSDRRPHISESAPSLPLQLNSLENILQSIGQEVDSRLRELSPEYRLQPKGYRLPIPRIEEIDIHGTLGEAHETVPIEIRDVLRAKTMTLLHLARTYPDRSLPWVIADDLLTCEIDGKQVVPIVVNGDVIHPPKSGFKVAAANHPLQEIYDNPAVQLVIVLENIPLQSQTRLKFLSDQIKIFPNAKFIFLTRGDINVVLESEFLATLSADAYKLCDISFIEIAHFIQKNFSMSGSESEVVALRLRETFDKFELEAHPIYFAGIQRNVLYRLLDANRRAELIQLAVDGFLTFIVAEDTAEINLSRTTRTRYLRNLAVALKVEKKAFTHEELIQFTRAFFEHHDFDIDPIQFIGSFVEKGILHFEGNRIAFSLPFIESYLLASALIDDPKLAASYFRYTDPAFDIAAFDLYAEIGAADSLVIELQKQILQRIEDLKLEEGESHILLTSQLQPKMLKNHNRLQGLQKELKTAADDIRNNRGGSEQKQRMLDIADRIKRSAIKKSKSLVSGGSQVKEKEKEKEKEKDQSELMNQEFDRLSATFQIWLIATVLLGSGAEHLNAETKQALAKDLIRLSTVLLHRWSTFLTKIDFTSLKAELTTEQALLEFAKSNGNKDKNLAETKTLVENLVDIIEFGILGEPFKRIVHNLCEQARQRILATSVEKAQITGKIESIVHAAWLADIDSQRGRQLLSEAIKQLPAAPFLRFNMATHFLIRVYWNHWKQEDRLALLEAADEAIKPIQLNLTDKGKIKRFIKGTKSRRRRSRR